MSKDPAFLFYPGDYLRDTQMLSEKTQVAYDRIMCEHMRNIHITQKQHKFLTKRLSEDEMEELNMVIVKVTGGYQIPWVVESISKRKAYSESRRKNREGKSKEDMLTYDTHMENENENENENRKKKMFIIPTIEEIRNYCKERKNTVNPNKWLAHYEANGWMVGKNKMKDWKAAVRTWENSEYSEEAKHPEVYNRMRTEGVTEDFFKDIPKGAPMPESLKKIAGNIGKE